MRIVAVGAVFLAMALACGSGTPQTGAKSLGTVDVIPSPWKELGVPKGDGNPWYCDASTCEIEYDGGDPKALAAPYVDAATSAGWVTRVTDDNPGHFMQLFDKDGQTLTIDAGPADFSGKVPGGVQVMLGVATTPTTP